MNLILGGSDGSPVKQGLGIDLRRELTTHKFPEWEESMFVRFVNKRRNGHVILKLRDICKLFDKGTGIYYTRTRNHLR